MTEVLDYTEIRPFNNMNLDSFFVFEAEEIEMAYRVSSLLQRGAKNIESSGNEVEVAVRNFFKRKLTSKYYTSNGHIIDTSLKVSPQFDIIIADNDKSPILYKSKDNTDFFIYESIYCIGEVKKSWYKKELLPNFISTISRMRNELKRNKVDPKFVDIGGRGAVFNVPTTEYPQKNPLFYFLLFVQSEELKYSDLTSSISSNHWQNIPNIICFLDKGLVVNINKKSFANGEIKINLYPEFLDETDTEENDWAFIRFRDKANVLAYLYILIVEHLNTTVLEVPHMLSYLKNMFNINKTDIEFIKK